MSIVSRTQPATTGADAAPRRSGEGTADETPPLGIPIVRPEFTEALDTAPDAPAPPDERPAATAARRRFVRAYVAGVTLGTLAFVAVLGDGRFAPFRTAVASRVFSNFYDVQARALLDGNLDVPVGSLSIEGFRLGGREYMYFPPWPSVLRMPLLLVTDRFDGRLSALSILLAYVAAVVFAGLIAWRVRAILIPDAPCGPLTVVGVAVWGALLGAGSTMTFLASLPWVYHEAYMWAVAGTLGALWALIEVWRRPTLVRMITAWFLTTVTILSRTTAGWAMCAALVAAGLLMLWRPPLGRSRWRGVGIAAAGATALAVGIAVNWTKFRHPYLFPLDRQVWTALNESRAAALDANGGHLTGPQFLPTMARAYLRPDGIRFTSMFPWITLPAEPVPVWGGAVVDQRYRTGSVTAFMPLYVALSFAGLIALVRSRQTDRAILRLTALAALVIPGPIFVYGYVSHRYTAEFLPALVVLSAVGLTTLSPLERARRRWSPLVSVAIVVAGAYGIAVHSAISVESARVTGRGAPLESLVDRRLEWSGLFGDDPAPTPTSSGALPSHPPTDQLAVVGDCEAVYLATGDLYEPWVPVAIRGLDVSVSVPEHLGPGETTLVRLNGPRRRALVLQHDGIGNVRLAVVGNAVDEWSDWTPLEPGVTVRLSISARTSRNQFLIDAPGWVHTTVPIADWDDEWISVPNLLEPARPSRPDRAGVVVRSAWARAPSICADLAAAG